MTLPARRGSWLTRPRIVGTPLHWARQAGTLGALLGGLAPAALLAAPVVGAAGQTGFSLAIVGVLGLMCGTAAAAGGALGAILGLLTPAVLDGVRSLGRWTVPFAAVSAAGIGSGVGAVSAAAFLVPAVVLGGPVGAGVGTFIVAIGAVVGGGAAAAWWLPLTLSTVLERQWPVTRAVGLGLPMLLLVAMSVFLAVL